VDPIEEFEATLSGMLGRQCWSFSASINTGSHVVLDIGRKIRRKRPLRNPRISEEERLYEGEFNLYITCSWRLGWKEKVLCGGEDDNSNEGPMQHGLQYLLGRRVTSVNLERPGLDLELRLENDLSLRIFCDEFGIEEHSPHYTLFLPNYYYSVEGRSRIAKKAAAESGRALDFQLVSSSTEEEVITWDKAVAAPLERKKSEHPELSSMVGGICKGFEISDEKRSPIELSVAGNRDLGTMNLIIGCSWRLDSASEVLCGIGMSHEEIHRGLDQMVGNVIRAIDVSPEMDLRVYFESGLKLSIFCDHVNEVSMWDNYLVEGPWGSFIVGTCGEVRREA
jgi:hypothetical protein